MASMIQRLTLRSLLAALLLALFAQPAAQAQSLSEEGFQGYLQLLSLIHI